MSPAIKGNSYAKGNSGGSAPEGNKNAVGNNGGAPIGNDNAAKHYGWSDSLKHYDRLEGTARERVDGLIASSRREYAEYHDLAVEDVEAHIVEHQDFDSEADVRDAFRKLATKYDQWNRAACAVFEEGWGVEEEVEFEDGNGETHTFTNTKLNPAVKAEHRLNTKRRQLEVQLGLIENERYLGCQ